MTMRTTAIILGLAGLAGGCTITTHHDADGDYRHEHRVIHEADSYEGYYYVRVIYLNGIPWYVDEDLQARPVPHHLRSHFRYASWSRSAPPRFSQDVRERDGYRLSRIVYINGVPHHVDEERRARPIPSRLRKRFSYESVARQHDNGRRPDVRSGNEGRPLPPAYRREREDSPVYKGGNALGRVTERVREETRPVPPASERDRYEPNGYEADNAPRRGTPRQRMDEERGPLPSASGNERQTAYEADNGPRRGMPSERVREDSSRQDPPFARNARSEQYEDQRGHGRDERRPLPRDMERDADYPQRAGRGAPQAPQDIAQRDSGQPQSAGDDRQRGRDAVNGSERSADPASERKNGKGRGPRKGEESDSADERDDHPGKGKRRDE